MAPSLVLDFLSSTKSGVQGSVMRLLGPVALWVTLLDLKIWLPGHGWPERPPEPYTGEELLAL